MDKNGMIFLLKQEVRGLSSKLVANDYDNAIEDAQRETGWAFPVTVDFRIHWLKLRAKRHLFFYLASESAHKFKAKQFSLNQRFEHYTALIKNMDEEFLLAQEMHPEEFTGADVSALFGHKIDAGYAYDEFGRDITFDSDQQVIINPKNS
jgi:hypothetical protein